MEISKIQMKILNFIMRINSENFIYEEKKDIN